MRNPANSLAILLLAATILALHPRLAHAAGDEIQVYTDELNRPGQYGLEVHTNLVMSGRATPDYRGEQPPAHQFRLTPEFSLGATDTFELGLYLLSTRNEADGATFDGAKVRLKYIAPREKGEEWFWGINYELGRLARRVAETPVESELKGIVGRHHGRWLLAANLNVDWGFGGAAGSATPDLELAYKASWSWKKDLAIGLEQYAGLGPLDDLGRLGDRSQTLYCVADAKLGDWGLNFGVGRGLSDSSDQWIVKSIVEVPIDE